MVMFANIAYFLSVAVVSLSPTAASSGAVQTVPTFASLPADETLVVNYVVNGCFASEAHRLSFRKKEKNLFVTVSKPETLVDVQCFPGRGTKVQFFKIGEIALTQEDVQKLDAMVRYLRSAPQRPPSSMNSGFNISHFRESQKLAEESISESTAVPASTQNDKLSFSDLLNRIKPATLKPARPTLASLIVGDLVLVTTAKLGTGGQGMRGNRYIFSRTQESLSVVVMELQGYLYPDPKIIDPKFVKLGEIVLTTTEIQKLDELFHYLRTKHKSDAQDQSATSLNIGLVRESRLLASEGFASLTLSPQDDLLGFLPSLVDRVKKPKH